MTALRDRRRVSGALLRFAPTCGHGPGTIPFPVDPDKLRPQAVLHLRLSEEALRTRRGVAVLENHGTGPITAAEAIDLLGRIKTHGRGWRHTQPIPGVYLWRTPTGYRYRVDQHGTHPLRHPLGREPDSLMERRLLDLIQAS